MGEYTSFKAGGEASILVIPEDIVELQYAMEMVFTHGVPFYIMGNGSNILVRDGGFPGVIVKIGRNFARVKVKDTEIEAGSGALLKDVANAALKYGLTGFEFASGIPGSIGGAAYMNAGAYKGDMSKVVKRVHILKADGKEDYYLSGEEMGFGYRKSVLMEGRDIILSVTLELSLGDKDEITRTMEDFNGRRKEKQPLNFPSGGSFFKRPTGNFAGTLIQDSGLKGTTIGGAQVSELHAGFIINKGGATATDILTLMEVVQKRVYEKSGITLEPELRIIGED
jgi:UDP-N-acetylmuramate dehydrogenase